MHFYAMLLLMLEKKYFLNYIIVADTYYLSSGQDVKGQLVNYQ